MSLTVTQLGTDILAAFKGELSDEWPEIKIYAQTESKKLAHSLRGIEKLIISGEINQEQAKLLLSIQKDATLAYFLAIEGLTELAIEAAINAALDAVKEAVNGALGFVLI